MEIKRLKGSLSVSIGLLLSSSLMSQYAGGINEENTTAIHADSSIVSFWAHECSVELGPQDVSDLSLGDAATGTASAALGKANGINVVSLGDGGSAIVSFQGLIEDGPGWDFAVYENSFSNTFLELAHVEVSSDGENYFRFPSHSLTQDSVQVGSFGAVDPQLINNLAGKYPAMWGTPFDLSELSDQAGLNLDSVAYVKIIDVIGSIDPSLGSQDTAGNFINDPWPTPFASSGFDLDAVGVINGQQVLSSKDHEQISFRIFPTPAKDFIYLRGLEPGVQYLYTLANSYGEVVKRGMTEGTRIDLFNVRSGMYVFKLSDTIGSVGQQKIIIYD